MHLFLKVMTIEYVFPIQYKVPIFFTAFWDVEFIFFCKEIFEFKLVFFNYLLRRIHYRDKKDKTRKVNAGCKDSKTNMTTIRMFCASCLKL